jgi:hypothetical protein
LRMSFRIQDKAGRSERWGEMHVRRFVRVECIAMAYDEMPE